MKLTHSFHFLFLVWNLFLAVIPFAITAYLISNPKLSKYGLYFWFCVWLLFLPNAPYIITDLLHLKVSSSYLLWLDVLVVTSFALNGLLLFLLSITDMKAIMSRFTNNKYVNPIFIFILFLCGFGVYLGRFLRYNSWEVIQNPLNLLNDIIFLIIHPNLNLEACLFTFIFGSFLNVAYWMFKQLYANTSK
ncbi:DUF1361 domain-containing protein [Confluentibacter sediminis]|uniref:DUF1361 domain-containing protein n=1 Tax=Confluentibacter sediminis TaxID=2219045 RepID=UPI0013A6D866|nr:DUF1361 domain-containing protein [Confluentibacter sediminis]